MYLSCNYIIYLLHVDFYLVAMYDPPPKKKKQNNLIYNLFSDLVGAVHVVYSLSREMFICITFILTN